jgi:hypothetical protein
VFQRALLTKLIPSRNTRNPELGRFSFRVFRVFRGYHFGCGFAALGTLRFLCPARIGN